MDRAGFVRLEARVVGGGGWWVQGSEHGFIPPGENQVAVLGNFKPTGGESKSQNASSSVK